MGKIAVYVERYNISNAYEMNAIMRFTQVARKLGHWTDFLFRPDMFKIPQYDALFIRALTDPLNSAYVAARTAEMHGVRVIDDPTSIRICCDKIFMYKRLLANNVPIPDSVFIDWGELTHHKAKEILDRLGSPVVLKAPNSSFSMYVDRGSTVEEVMTLGKKYFRRADRIVAQKFIKSEFDWRVGTLDGEALYVCQYVIPRKRWKIMTYTQEGRAIYGPVRGVPLAEANPLLLQRALEASAAIGRGLYGVDLKQVGDDFVVIEVNDNPTIMAGDEDQKAGDLYERLIRYLVPNGATG